MEIKVLASGSAGNAYTISDGSTTLLIECGLPWNELKVKLNFALPDACLISHSHGDHANCLDRMLGFGIPCYASKETFDECKVISHLRNNIEHGKLFSVGSFDIQPLEMAHDVKCMGFYIYSRRTGDTLFFATDTYYIPYKLPSLDYIMVEANYDTDILNRNILSGHIDPAMKSRLVRSHMEINNTASWLLNQDLTKTRRIYLLHLSDGNSNAEEFKAKVIEATGVPVTIAGG